MGSRPAANPWYLKSGQLKVEIPCTCLSVATLTNRGVNSSFSFNEFLSLSFQAETRYSSFFLVTCILTTPPKEILESTWGGEAVRILVH
jgi:hypothetical protein